MAHGLTNRDIQAGKEQAWHRLTKVFPVINRENSMPFEVRETPICYKVPGGPFEQERIIEDPDWKILLATDDNLPVGDPYGSTYHPTSIDGFWKVIEQGMGETPYEVISAGTTDNRGKVFATIKVTEGFRIKDREFKDYVNILDSFDKSCALTACYSTICTVCANTFAANLQSGNVLGKAKHTALIDVNIQRVIDAIDSFVGTSAYFQHLLTNADETPCSRDEARAWITGLECRNTGNLTNGIRQRTARIIELFDGGKGNSGRTRLDAFQGLTEFYSHESSRNSDNQLYQSEWGTGAQVKRFVAANFDTTWEKFRKQGEALLSA
jgi:hypothetical protein